LVFGRIPYWVFRFRNQNAIYVVSLNDVEASACRYDRIRGSISRNGSANDCLLS
jgi:hypothetical protein